jgi:hypothetical protein
MDTDQKEKLYQSLSKELDEIGGGGKGEGLRKPERVEIGEVARDKFYMPFFTKVVMGEHDPVAEWLTEQSDSLYRAIEKTNGGLRMHLAKALAECDELQKKNRELIKEVQQWRDFLALIKEALGISIGEGKGE